MLKRWTQPALITVLLALPAALFASGEGWETNMKKAMEKATKEKKDLLIDFTGSDWCGWCIKLGKEVFSQDVFKKEAPKHFVLVSLDFPQKKKLAEELTKHNKKWMEKLGVTGFPTIFLTDGKGKPYAKTGYQPGGAEPYLKHLAELRKLRVARDEALAKAKRASGTKKAKLLDEAIGTMDAALITGPYKELAQEIMKLDKKDKAGLKSKYESMFLMQDVQKLMQQRKTDEAVAKIDEALKKLKPAGETVQELLFMKSQVLYNKRDQAGAKKALEDAIAAAPKSATAKQIRDILKRFFSDKPKKGAVEKK